MRTILSPPLAAAALAMSLAVGSVSAQEPGADSDLARGDGSAALRFNFSGAPWQGVLEWFSEQADLSLQLDQTPTGSFTFADPSRAYTVSEGLDVINLTLMRRGYSLVRRGRMLQVIDLENENASKLISELAELVPAAELEQRGNSDIVSCLMPLGSLSPDDAKQELGQMIGPWGRVIVLNTARQVKVTETAEKLIAIRDMLKSAAMADTSVVEIVLKHRGSDELLEIARPLLGLEAGENSNEEIRISVGVYGDRIYAAGLPGKTGLLEALVEKADQPLTVGDTNTEVSLPTLRTHTVGSADTTTVFDVLQTLLADAPDVRISIEPRSKGIIAWARPETHKVIAETIAEMEGRGQEFKVIDLKRLDPTQALLTINKFFGVTEQGGDGPIVDGDPATGKLWVRGTRDQIALVERLLSELEGSDALGSLSDKVRILPYTGSAAEEALIQVQGIWSATGRKNLIRTIAPARGGSGSSGIRERRSIREPEPKPRLDQPAFQDEARDNSRHRYHFVVAQDDLGRADSQPDDVPSTRDPDASDERTVNTEAAGARLPTTGSTRINVGGADIIVQFTPAGMMVASEDTEALDTFQALMESFASPSALQSDLPTIIWLKYIKAEVAAELISSVLGGGEGGLASAVDNVTGGLGGGMLGLLGFGGGGGGDESTAKSVITSTGSVNIIPDARLNALIVQANPIDMQMIEMILEKVDRAESPEDIETGGKPQLIPVVYQDARDVADVVREVFGERITGAQKSGGGGGGQPSPQDFLQMMRGGRGGGNNNKATSKASTISIAVDETSNSLVVIATPQDFFEVQQLVRTLDERGMQSEDTMTVYQLDGSVNPELMKAALESIMTTTATDAREADQTRTQERGGAAAQARQQAQDMQRRIQFFQQMRERGGRGGGDAGRGGRGGGNPFGGRGGRGGGNPFGGRGGGGQDGGGRGGR